MCVSLKVSSCQDMLRFCCHYKPHPHAYMLAAVAVLLDIFAEHYSPVTLTLTNGIRVNMVRYALWILTCPVGYTASCFQVVGMAQICRDVLC